VRFSPRLVISVGAGAAAAGSAVIAVTQDVWLMGTATAVFGVAVGAAMTAAYTAAASVIPAGTHGTAFGVLTSASLTGLAVSPVVAGFVGATTIRLVFIVDTVMMTILAVLVRRKMIARTAGSRGENEHVD
jgi:MFS family permease